MYLVSYSLYAQGRFFFFTVFCYFVCSNVREGVCAGEWSVFGQEENQSSKEEPGPHLPAGSVVWWESSGQSSTGMRFTPNKPTLTDIHPVISDITRS